MGRVAVVSLSLGSLLLALQGSVEAIEDLRPYIQPRFSKLEVQAAHSCNITESEPCDVEDLAESSRTLIYPGGSTSCLWGQPYAFIYYPGRGETEQNLLINFQGGGACFLDKERGFPGTCSRNAPKSNVLCTTNASPDVELGIFATEDPKNPYDGWTKVSVLYCSGDLHVGNTTRHYSGKNETTKATVEDESYQFGYNNALAALKWTFKNMPKPKKLVVAGQSAGALGGHLWADYIFTQYKELKDSQRAVILDSYGLAVLPDNQGTALKQMGICETMLEIKLLTEQELAVCKEEKLWFNSVASRIHQKYKGTPFVAVQSKFDSTQELFYTGLSLMSALGKIPAVNLSIPQSLSLVFPVGSITDKVFYEQSGEVLGYFVNNSDNVLHYIVNSSQHVYMGRQNFTKDRILSQPEKPLLVDYLRQFPLQDGASAVSFCEEDPNYPCEAGWNKTFTQGAQQSDPTGSPGPSTDGTPSSSAPTANKQNSSSASNPIRAAGVVSFLLAAMIMALGL